MNKKTQEKQIQEDIFSYFDISNPHPEISAMVLNYDIALLEFIDPTPILNHSKACEILLHNDHDNKWFKIFDKLQYVDDSIFLNIISQASHTTVPEYDEEEKRTISRVAFYEDRFHFDFLNHISENEKIKNFVNSISNDETKLIELCNKNFYFFLLARDNQLIETTHLKSIFMDYFNDVNSLGEWKESKLAKLSLSFFDEFTPEELKLVSETYFSHYIVGYHLKSKAQFFESDNLLKHFIEYSKKSLHNNFYYSHDYERFLCHFCHTIQAKGDNIEVYLKKLFKELSKDYGQSLTYILLDSFKNSENELFRQSLCQYLKPIDFVNYIEKGKFYSSHLEVFKALPLTFWQKMQNDQEAYSKLFDVFTNMDSHFVKESCAILPFVFKKEDSLLLINHYLKEHTKEMYYIYQTLLEPKALDEKLYEHLDFQLDNNYNIQDSAIKSVLSNYKKDPQYIEKHKDSIEYIFNKIFSDTNLKTVFSDVGNYNFKYEFSDLLLEHFPQVLLNNLSPDNNQNFLFIQNTPTFLDDDKTHHSEIAKQKLQLFFWDNRTKEFNAPTAHILKARWDKCLERKNNKHLYDKFYFEHAVIRETPKTSKKLKI